MILTWLWYNWISIVSARKHRRWVLCNSFWHFTNVLPHRKLYLHAPKKCPFINFFYLYRAFRNSILSIPATVWNYDQYVLIDIHGSCNSLSSETLEGPTSFDLLRLEASHYYESYNCHNEVRTSLICPRYIAQSSSINLQSSTNVLWISVQM